MPEVHEYYCGRCGKTSWVKLRIGWSGPHSPIPPVTRNVCDNIDCSADILEREAEHLRALFDQPTNTEEPK